MSRLLGSKDFWLGGVRAEGAAFREAVRGADLAAPVPSCPEWTVGDLVAHLGDVYAYVLHHVSRGVTDPPERTRTSFHTQPDAGVVDWWEGRFTELMTALDGLDPELPAFNWAPQPKRVAFWHRRMAHETAVHRWDAQFATARAEPVEAKLAVDGVAEVLDTLLPAGKGTGPKDLRGVVGLVATDADHEWYIRLRGEGGFALLDTNTLLDKAAPHERAVARGPASDLLLALWGRIDFDVLEVSGDVRLLEALRAG
ncbi:MAG: maleylpyruvate isomerase family mycothiol-dependent enzyme [Micromonosporaceae bacterium]|nr:maleylpyruvate isomerase family mycothiol-dependent enzyme [Micromonosporaceae bacterium]